MSIEANKDLPIAAPQPYRSETPYRRKRLGEPIGVQERHACQGGIIYSANTVAILGPMFLPIHLKPGSLTGTDSQANISGSCLKFRAPLGVGCFDSADFALCPGPRGRKCASGARALE